MIKQTEIIRRRKEMLKRFDYYVRNVICDTCNIWFADGLPNDCDEDLLHFIVTDEECWLNCVKAFAECCEAAEVL